MKMLENVKSVLAFQFNHSVLCVWHQLMAFLLAAIHGNEFLFMCIPQKKPKLFSFSFQIAFVIATAERILFFFTLEFMSLLFVRLYIFHLFPQQIYFRDHSFLHKRSNSFQLFDIFNRIAIDTINCIHTSRANSFHHILNI